MLNFAYRLAYIPTDGGGGLTNGVSMLIQPFARSRSARNARFSIGAEIAFREAPGGHTDGIVWLTFGVGAQWPGRVATPYLQGVAFGGIALGERFQLPQVTYAITMGPELGVDLRAVGFAGLGFAVGGGWTQIGNQWSLGAWGKASLAFW